MSVVCHLCQQQDVCHGINLLFRLHVLTYELFFQGTNHPQKTAEISALEIAYLYSAYLPLGDFSF